MFNGSAYQRTPINVALVKLNSKAEWKLFLEFLILFYNYGQKANFNILEDQNIPLEITVSRTRQLVQSVKCIP